MLKKRTIRFLGGTFDFKYYTQDEWESFQRWLEESYRREIEQIKEELARKLVV